MPTELVWEGKFDAKGCKKAPLHVQLPFQEVETVNESALDRGKQLDLFHAGQPRAWRNRLIWGDKKYVLPSLLPEFAGQINLIYIDPPFAVGSDFQLHGECAKRSGDPVQFGDHAGPGPLNGHAFKKMQIIAPIESEQVDG